MIANSECASRPIAFTVQSRLARSIQNVYYKYLATMALKAYSQSGYTNYKVSAHHLTMILLGIVILAAIIVFKSETAVIFISDPFLLAYAFFITIFQLSRLTSALFYRSSYRQIVPRELEENPHMYEPRVTFVIPAKNEEDAIKQTIEKCYEVDYPSEKLEVIAINDGSTDRTGEIMKALRSKYPTLTVINWKKNRGKRHGMAEGFRRATGDIIIQLDSDSYIYPETFRQLIVPFSNPSIGAVCAHANPQNSDKNLLTKMQTAYYFMSFRVLKAAESTYQVVFCCSGCSSAYRKKVVMPIIDLWLNERFLGLPCTYGDDRALTTWVIKQGYKTVYSDQVRACTIIPEKFKTFVKQQVRWKKSWIINLAITSKFIWKKEKFVAFTYFFPLAAVSFLTPFIAARAMFYNSIIGDVTPIYYLTGLLLITFLIIIFYRYVERKNPYWPYLILWTLFNALFLAYLLPYAFLTIQNRKWGTR